MDVDGGGSRQLRDLRNANLVGKKCTRLINKLEILDAIDKTIVENLIDSLIAKKHSGVSVMETSRIS